MKSGNFFFIIKVSSLLYLADFGIVLEGRGLGWVEIGWKEDEGEKGTGRSTFTWVVLFVCQSSSSSSTLPLLLTLSTFINLRISV